MRGLALRLLWPVMAGLIVGACATTTPQKSTGLAPGVAPRSERQVNPKEAAAAFAELGAEYLRRKQYADSKEKLDRALEYDPNNFEANWVMGSLLEHIDRPAEADRYYTNALRLQPNNPEVSNTYAAYLCKSGKVDEALKLFEGLTRNKLFRTPWAAATNAAVCLRADKRNADALAYIDRALMMKPDYVDAVLQKADLQLALGRGRGARETIDGYLVTPRPKENDPQRPDLLLIGVRAALADADKAAAGGYGTQLMRDFPNSPQATAASRLLQGVK